MPGFGYWRDRKWLMRALARQSLLACRELALLIPAPTTMPFSKIDEVAQNVAILIMIRCFPTSAPICSTRARPFVSRKKNAIIVTD